jgi:hypothetical protein
MELLFLNCILIGSGLLILLFIRALPRVEELAPLKRGMLERWLTSQLPERIDAMSHAAFLRTLRRLKVFTLRIDNSINKKLQRMKLESGEAIGMPKIDLKKVVKERAMRVEHPTKKSDSL